MKIYFHQTIVGVLSKYLPNLFDRYHNDYIVAIIHEVRKEKICKHLDGDESYCLMTKGKCVGKEYCCDYEREKEIE